MVDAVFFAVAMVLAVLLFVVAFRVKRFSLFLSTVFLFAASLAAAIGFAGGVLVYFEKRPSSTVAHPPTPDIFSQYANPHILIKDSILYIVPPRETFKSFGHKFSSNGFGFREREFSHEKPDGVYRILVLGDSMTFGVGIDSDHRYTNLLEEMLNLKSKSKRYEVLNFGMGGYSTDQERDLLTAILKKVQFDLVIVGFFWNDLMMTTQTVLASLVLGEYPINLQLKGIDNPEIFRNSERHYMNIPKGGPDEFSSVRPWYKQTGIYRFLELRSNINRDGLLPNTKLWQYERNEFLEMLKLTKQYDMPSPVVALLYNGFVDPHQNNFRNPKGQLAQHIRVMQFVGEELSKEGFPIIDPLPLFRKYSGMSMSISEWETHPNYLPHYIFAQSIFDYLVAKKVVMLK